MPGKRLASPKQDQRVAGVEVQLALDLAKRGVARLLGRQVGDRIGGAIQGRSGPAQGRPAAGVVWHIRNGTIKRAGQRGACRATGTGRVLRTCRAS